MHDKSVIVFLFLKSNIVVIVISLLANAKSGFLNINIILLFTLNIIYLDWSPRSKEGNKYFLIIIYFF